MSPLAGKTIVITRALHQSTNFEGLLRERQAVPLLYPCLAVAPPDDITLLDSALNRIANGGFDWLILTSANTVRALAQRLNALELSPTIFASVKIAAIGSATAEAARCLLNLKVIAIPDTYLSEDLARTIQPSRGARVLLPLSTLANPSLARILSTIGARVTTVYAYRTIVGMGGVNLPELLRKNQVGAVTFTSPSTVTYGLQRLTAEGGDLATLARACIACIGPKTAATIHKRNLPVHVTPVEHTVKGLIAALEHYFSERIIGA
jgi:uroporphyrinogen-III synthase